MTNQHQTDPRCIRCGAAISNESLEQGLACVISAQQLRLRLAVTCPDCPQPVLAMSARVRRENAA
jgi:DNA-directed RNA polymerase subunit RPC12/RpoP